MDIADQRYGFARSSRIDLHQANPVSFATKEGDKRDLAEVLEVGVGRYYNSA